MTIFLPLTLLFCFALSRMKFKDLPSLDDVLAGIKRLTWMEWIFIAAIIFGTVSVFLLSIAFPMHFWDARAIWATKAKLLFYDGTIFSSGFTDAEQDQRALQIPAAFPDVAVIDIFRARYRR